MIYKKEDVDNLIRVLEDEFLTDMRRGGVLNFMTRDAQGEMQRKIEKAIKICRKNK